MTRVSKDPEVRRMEILDSAEKLFKEKGYAKTAINDIVREVQVAQGTFYYYFKSKEDIIVAVMERHLDEIIKKVQEVVNNTSLNAIQKLIKAGQDEMEINRRQDELFNELHTIENAGIHQRCIVGLVQKLIPLYTNIIQQGIEEGVFNTLYPKEAAEYMLVATRFMFDPGVFPQEESELYRRAAAAQNVCERALGLKDGGLTVSQ